MNGRNETVPVAFIKIRRGQYTFGSKKIILQLERDKLTVKVGGGYLPIEEFVRTYTEMELTRKPKSRSPHSRKLLGKWAESLVQGGTSPPQQLRENLKQASGKFAISFGVKRHKRYKSMK